MKNITKTIITAVLLLIIVGLFAQDSTDDKAIVKDANGISTGMTQKEFDQFKADYMAKYEKLKPKDSFDGFKKMFFNGKCNINKADDLIKLNVNIFPKDNGVSFESMTIIHPLVMVGTVKSVKYLDENLSEKEAYALMQKFQIASFYDFEVEQVVKGQELLEEKYKQIPSNLKIGSRAGLKIHVSSISDFTVGQKYMLIANISDEKDLNGRNYISASPLYTITDDNVNLGYKTEYLSSCILRINILQEINDEKNFYKLNFKE